MSASETLKTRSGIKRFLLPNGDEEDVVLAFDYLDRKTEVHLLKVRRGSISLKIIEEGCPSARGTRRVFVG